MNKLIKKKKSNLFFMIFTYKKMEPWSCTKRSKLDQRGHIIR